MHLRSKRATVRQVLIALSSLERQSESISYHRVLPRKNRNSDASRRNKDIANT